jgi:glycine/D-amino acid oxidase-like deaminating enzyme
MIEENMNNTAAADIVIFGGGIAGLWLLSRLRQSGLSAILFESGSLGGGQTHKAQGIIHGGVKYALQGSLTAEAKAMANLPALWNDCLRGKGEVDLSGVPILSPQHYLWTPRKFASTLTGLLASAALTSKVAPLSKEAYPAVFQNSMFKGQVFSLDEVVIDVQGLVRELVKANQDAVYKIEPFNDDELKFDEHSKIVSATVYMAGKPLEVFAQQFIFTAGAGNELIVKKLKSADVVMQRRPLHMVLVKTSFDYPLYAHCLGLGARPRITITTHRTQEGELIWYLGGQLAEEGVGRGTQEQIQAARAELNALFPWLDFSQAEFATFMVDRAESKQKNGLKPETAYMKVIENMIVAWPTKLALAPTLADSMLKHLQKSPLVPQLYDIRALRSWPMPPLAKPIWEDAF